VDQEDRQAEDAEGQRQGPEQGEERARVLAPGVERHAEDDVAQGHAEEQGRQSAAADEGGLP